MKEHVGMPINYYVFLLSLNYESSGSRLGYIIMALLTQHSVDWNMANKPASLSSAGVHGKSGCGLTE